MTKCKYINIYINKTCGDGCSSPRGPAHCWVCSAPLTQNKSHIITWTRLHAQLQYLTSEMIRNELPFHINFKEILYIKALFYSKEPDIPHNGAQYECCTKWKNEHERIMKSMVPGHKSLLGPLTPGHSKKRHSPTTCVYLTYLVPVDCPQESHQINTWFNNLYQCMWIANKHVNGQKKDSCTAYYMGFTRLKSDSSFVCSSCSWPGMPCHKQGRLA